MDVGHPVELYLALTSLRSRTHAGDPSAKHAGRGHKIVAARKSNSTRALSLRAEHFVPYTFMLLVPFQG